MPRVSLFPQWRGGIWDICWQTHLPALTSRSPDLVLEESSFWKVYTWRLSRSSPLQSLLCLWGLLISMTLFWGGIPPRLGNPLALFTSHPGRAKSWPWGTWYLPLLTRDGQMDKTKVPCWKDGEVSEVWTLRIQVLPHTWLWYQEPQRKWKCTV
jgi:hypothetical protein